LQSQNKKDMFFRRKHLVEFGYKVMGLDFGSNDTYNHYVKYFPEHNSMVVFSSIHNNRVLVYRLTKQQYDDFQEGKFALSHDGKGWGSTPSGYPIKNHGITTIFAGGDITRRKYLKEMLDVAEEMAQGKEIEFEFVIKRK
jgi:hypothetical protein